MARIWRVPMLPDPGNRGGLVGRHHLVRSEGMEPRTGRFGRHPLQGGRTALQPAIQDGSTNLCQRGLLVPRHGEPTSRLHAPCVKSHVASAPQAVKRSVLVRGKERAYFQILHESACVSNAYKKLSGQPFEDMGKKETRARLDREVLIAQSAATQGPRQAKKRSEPLGTDSRGRRFWALKSDPNFIFTQVLVETCIFCAFLCQSVCILTSVLRIIHPAKRTGASSKAPTISSGFLPVSRPMCRILIFFCSF
jgi:hypothetical protein